MQKISLKALFAAVITGLTLLGCNGSQTQSNAASTEGAVFNDGTDLNPASFLVTGEGSSSSGNAWFCSVVNGSNFISRSTFEFYANNEGRIDDADIQWAPTETDSLLLSTPNGDIELANVEFSNRLYTRDHFDALLDNTLSLSCDWSGPPRVGSMPLSDENGDTFVDEFGEELAGVERLLITSVNGSTNNSMWRCELIDAQNNRDYIEYQFYAASRGFAVLDFEWAELNEDAIRIFYPDNIEYDLTNIVFTDDLLEKFVASDSRGYSLDCDWFGPSRVN